jgi:seryl-tRNA synthetase
MPVKPAKDADALRADVRTLDSKVSLIVQKLSTIEKNEEVLGRTLVALNSRVRALEEDGPEAGARGSQAASGNAAEAASLRKDVDGLKKEVQEMRYVLNSINPLEFVTADQVKELLKEKK